MGVAGKATKAAVDNLHAVLVTELTKVVSDGVQVVTKEGEVVKETAPAAYFKEARELLKDNGVVADIASNTALQNLAAILPFPEGAEDEIRRAIQ